MKIKGSVSLFMAMIFLMVISVITTTIMSAGIHGAKVKVSTSVSSSVDSVFAAYDSELFEKFGVLLFEGSDKNKICESINHYLSKNISVDGGVDLYGIKIKGINISRIINATDGSGLLWMDSAVDYEKYAKPINLAADFLGINDSGSKLEKIGEIIEGMSFVSDTVGYVNDNTKDLTRYIDGVEIINNHISETDEQYYLKKLKMPGIILENAKNIYRYDNSGFEKTIRDLQKDIDGILKTTETIELKYEHIDSEIDQISHSVNILMDDVKEVEDILGKETVDGFCEEFEKMSNYKDILAENAFDLDKFINTLQVNKGILIEAKGKLVQINSVEDINEVIEIFKNYSLDGYEIDYGYFLKKKGRNNIFSTIKKLFQEGILGLVIPKCDSVSMRYISENYLASDVTYQNSKNILKNCGFSTKSAKKIIYGEYVMDHFTSYTDKQNGDALDYEVEYVINGEKSDIANLYYTVKKIALIRSAVNMAYIMTDSDKKERAESLAEIAVGWTNIQPLVKGMKYLILYGWSYAEGLVEVKALLSGWKISLLKNSDNWQMEYEDFITLNFEPDEEKSQKGLNYEMFLRALLMMNDLGEISLNTMDLVELWKIRNGDKDFRMKNQVFGLKGEVLYSVGNNREYVYSFAQTY